MYIPEFWCGVLATITFEVLVLFILILYACFRANGKSISTVEEQNNTKEM